MNFKQKITTGLATGAVLLSAIAPAAFAATSVHISGNGAFSQNRVNVSQSHSLSASQSNNANISNSVNVSSNTGGNNASFNTGGSVAVVSGDANTHVGISNIANANILSLGGVGHGGNGGGMSNNWNKLHTFMTGGQEVPTPGDPDGFGTAKVKVHPAAGKLCVSLWVKNIEPATAAHIHEAPVGVAGPVVVALPTPNAQGFASGCVDVASSELTEIKNNPSDYYVNVHNAPYPGGAVRGQLSN
ncbi:MAG TPA: CHRD domain-containing protein [Xanthomonadales bacterium]|nr:CHRD domain-containing protein [Xanthomonadales bacterium]